jgi:hypothetical protein
VRPRIVHAISRYTENYGVNSKNCVNLKVALQRNSGVPRREFGGVQHPHPPEIPTFWQSRAEFPVPWKIHPQQPNKNTGFTHLQVGQNPWLGGYRPRIPVLSALCPQLNLLNPSGKKSWVRHFTQRFHWPRTLLARRRSAAVRLLGMRVRTPHSLICERCVLSGTGLCVEPVTRPEESHRVCCV